MPFTPFHFSPSAVVALPLRKYIGFPFFVLASVAVDIEPLVVIVFNLNYPLHGYFHTFLFGLIIGIIYAVIMYFCRNAVYWFMKKIKLPYSTNLKKMLISGVFGVWFHILVDAPIYSDIKPFYPLETNSLYGLLSDIEVYIICSVSLLFVYLYLRVRR